MLSMLDKILDSRRHFEIVFFSPDRGDYLHKLSKPFFWEIQEKYNQVVVSLTAQRMGKFNELKQTIINMNVSFVSGECFQRSKYVCLV